MANFDGRYDGEMWPLILPIAHRGTGGICACCCAAQSKEVHHLRYKDEHGAIAGREVPGVDVVPVCLDCHIPICHDPENWITDKRNPKLNNRNTPEFAKFLRDNYQHLEEQHRGNLSNHRRLRQSTPRR